ncbi:MAG: ATP-binding protein [Desulfobacterales bacterium]|nr:ATP-binding protein [Desulfobacterales bacterium]
MKKQVYLELNSRYDSFVKEYKTLTKEVVLRKAEILLKDIRDAGKTVAEPPHRNILSGMAYDLGRIIADNSDEFPPVRLMQPAEKSVEFVNRFSELGFITNIYCPPYLLISAPVGYGKTRLVQAVTALLQRQNWFCIHIDLWREKQYSIKELTYKMLREIGEEAAEVPEQAEPEKYGLEVCRAILNNLGSRRNVLILIDEAEALNDDLVKQLLEQFIPSVNNVLNNSAVPVQLRIILAGRYISNWKKSVSKIPLSLMSLPLFDFSAVYETVEKFSKSRLDMSPNYKQEFASHLMYFTGGHPGCMTEILKLDFGISDEEVVLKNESYFKTIIEPVITEIRKHIPDDLKSIFDTLSVVRRFNSRFLKLLTDNNMIRWAKDEYKLEQQLLETYLADKDKGFLKDDITRRLLAIRLSKTDLGHFTEVCNKSMLFYEERLKDLSASRPDIIAAELLFQKLQYVCHIKSGGKEEFFNSLTEVLKTLISGRESREVTEALTEQLNKDWEFRFTFNYLLKKDSYNHDYPFDELMDKIESFRQDVSVKECKNE